MAPKKPRDSREKWHLLLTPHQKGIRGQAVKDWLPLRTGFLIIKQSWICRLFLKKMDALLCVVMDLTMRVSVFEVGLDQGEASVRASPPISPPKRRARHQVTPTPIDEIAPDIHRQVVEQLRRAIPLNPDTQDEATSYEEEHPPEAECIRKGHPT